MQYNYVFLLSLLAKQLQQFIACLQSHRLPRQLLRFSLDYGFAQYLHDIFDTNTCRINN